MERTDKMVELKSHWPWGSESLKGPSKLEPSLKVRLPIVSILSIWNSPAYCSPIEVKVKTPRPCILSSLKVPT